MSHSRTVEEIVASLRELHGDNALPFIAHQLGCSMIAADEAATERWHTVAESFMHRPCHLARVRQPSSA